MPNNKATNSFTNKEINFPEIMLGIVSAVGTDIAPILQELKSQFEAKGYDAYHIKISDMFEEQALIRNYQGLKKTTRKEKIDTYIEFGNQLRKEEGNDFLAVMAMTLIAERRTENNESTEKRRSTDVRGTVYIIDQLKTGDELKLLRKVYGQLFFQISVYSARDIRVDNLSRIMAHDDKKVDRNYYRHNAEALVNRDENEADIPNGQKVGKIFQLGDVVFNADRSDEANKISKQVHRFVELLFGYNGYSPTRLEYGMFMAYTAALRSLDLSRQVGAAIFRQTGEIATLGANEVPKANGGTYWCDEVYDAREFTGNKDSNDTRKDELLHEVLEIVLDKNFKLSPEKTKKLQDSQFMDALEYGRIIHAEMSAISDAARLGVNISGGTLFCTTFPCHMCSKHIVASGLSRVVFLEPYPKSLTADLHSDSVKIEGTSRGQFESFPSVDFVPFFGITPTRYRELFYRQKRKKDGSFHPYRDGYPRPIISILLPQYLDIESNILLETSKILKSPNTNSTKVAKTKRTKITKP